MDNRISRLKGFNQIDKSQITLLYLIYLEARLLINISWLLESVCLCPTVIKLMKFKINILKESCHTLLPLSSPRSASKSLENLHRVLFAGIGVARFLSFRSQRGSGSKTFAPSLTNLEMMESKKEKNQFRYRYRWK
jgi:hypothetical protein